MTKGRLSKIILSVMLVYSLSACQTLEQSVSNFRQSLSTPSSSPESNREQTIAGNSLSAAAGAGCPAVSIIDELSSMHQFVDMKKPSAKNKISSIVLKGIRKHCLSKDGKTIIDIDLVFHGEAGPHARIGATDRTSFAYPWFLAITTNQGIILSKEIFAVTLSYDNDTNSADLTENIRHTLPSNKELYNKKYELLIGFQLGGEELAYNRKIIAKKVEEHSKSGSINVSHK